MGLAAVYERQGNTDAAIELYEKVLAKHPENAIAVNNLASLLSDNRTDEKSLARAKELAAKLEPVQQPALRDTLGWVYYRTGDYAKAVEVLEGVVNAMPKAAIFQYHLGMAYAKTGDKAKAKATLTKALELGDFSGADEARKVLNSL
jgi:Flp pilus assembly protein TadD